jgi:ABC-type multidrug transport system permease subunit
MSRCRHSSDECAFLLCAFLPDEKDEPTSGLDASSAQMVGDTLRRMCGDGGGGEARCSALCSIHQPRSSLLACFDSLLLLAEGRTVYFGPTGLADAAGGGGGAAAQQPAFPLQLPPFSMPPVPLLSGWLDSLRTLAPPPAGAAAAATAPGGVLAYFEGAGYSCPRFENAADFLLDLVHRPDVSKLAAMTAAAATTQQQQQQQQQQEALATPSGKRSGKRRRASASASAQIDPEAAMPPPATSSAAAPAPPPPPVVDALPAARVATAAAFAALYASSPLAAAAMAPPPAALLPPPLPEVGVDGASRYPTGWWNQFCVLFGRTMRYKLREPAAVLTQACTAVFLPLLVGGIYWRIPFTQNAIQDRLAAVSFLIMLQAFMCMDQILLFPKERAVYLRDHDAGLHSTSAFYLARTAAELPFILGFSAVCATEAYFCFGFQRSASRYLTFMAIICAVSEAGAALLCSFGALAPNMETGNLLATIVLVILILFDGFYINIQNIPLWCRWASKFSFLGYGVQAAAANEFRGLTFTCTPDEAALGCIATGDAYLARLGFADVSIGKCIGATLAIAVGARAIAYLGLRFLYTGHSFRERLFS